MSLEREYFSFGDALFLYLEREGAPLNIASVSIFEGIITRDQLMRYVESKLPHIPRYMQRVAMPPLNIGLPTWEFDPHFDITNHIHEVKLKRGTEGELKDASGVILSRRLDRSRPLWDLTLFHGLHGKRTGLMARVQHCMADGLSGIGLLNVLMEKSPKVPRLSRRKMQLPEPPQYAPGSQTLDAAMHSWFSAVERVLSAGNELLAMAQRLTGASAKSTQQAAGRIAENLPPVPDMDELSRLMPELTALPDRLPFNTLCNGPQRFEWTHIPFADLRAIKTKSGTTINDVALTLLTSAFRRYAISYGVNVKARNLRIVVPVSTRQEIHANDLGNHITFAPVSTPLGIGDMKKLLAAVHQRMQFVKTARVPQLVGFAGMLMGTIPSPLQAALAPMVAQLPISLCNTICTNVPGPQFPLYLMGHKMLAAYPYVPIGGEMGINVAMLTYDGTAYFGFTGDVHAAPELERLPMFLDASMEEMRKAMGLHRAVMKRPSRRAQPRTKPTAKPPSEPPKPEIQITPEVGAEPEKAKAAFTAA